MAGCIGWNKVHLLVGAREIVVSVARVAREDEASATYIARTLRMATNMIDEALNELEDKNLDGTPMALGDLLAISKLL